MRANTSISLALKEEPLLPVSSDLPSYPLVSSKESSPTFVMHSFWPHYDPRQSSFPNLGPFPVKHLTANSGRLILKTCSLSTLNKKHSLSFLYLDRIFPVCSQLTERYPPQIFPD